NRHQAGDGKGFDMERRESESKVPGSMAEPGDEPGVDDDRVQEERRSGDVAGGSRPRATPRRRRTQGVLDRLIQQDGLVPAGGSRSVHEQLQDDRGDTDAAD